MGTPTVVWTQIECRDVECITSYALASFVSVPSRQENRGTRSSSQAPANVRRKMEKTLMFSPHVGIGRYHIIGSMSHSSGTALMTTLSSLRLI